MSGILTGILVVLLLLVLDGAFAMSELAVMTARKVRLERRTDGFRVSAALAPYADALGLGSVVAGITCLSLVVGELVPRRVAVSAPERFASRGALMTPRPDVDWVDVEDEPQVLHVALGDGRRDLFLVCRGDVDHVVGFVRAEGLLARSIAGQPLDGAAPSELAQAPISVPATMPAFRLLEQLRAQRRHAAVVLDEYGGVAGVVTIDDVLAELVGEIPEPGDGAGELLVQREDGSWLVDGQAPIADVAAALDAEFVEEERPGYQTLGGFVMARLGHLPHAGEHLTAAGFRFGIADMDGRRVDRVLIARAARAGAAGGDEANAQ